MKLTCHANYERLADLARRAHQAGRSPHGIAAADITLARLYSHSFRMHVIGAFHATRLALSGSGFNTTSLAHLGRAKQLLKDLADLAMDPILPDMRALLATFHRYDCWIRQALLALENAQLQSKVGERFRAIMEEITRSNGIFLRQDTHAPEQASFVVPNLGITIVPLVYGDYHSWNLAWLPGPRSDVPLHLHREGVEIHLGYSPMRGETILGDCKAEVSDGGYAMPIPPLTTHGYVNQPGQVHHVPFIYGSLKAGGWGVFLDVDAQSVAVDSLKRVSRDAPEMNGTVYIDREIAKAEAIDKADRRVLIPAERTNRNGCGGLELAIARVTAEEFTYPTDSFRCVSVVRGEGMVHIAGMEQPVKGHDHFGIPATISATLRQKGTAPLVVLDAVIRG